MDTSQVFGEEFEVAVKEAISDAIRTTLAAGFPIFYRDSQSGLNIMEQPDGRRFEIRYVTDVAGDQSREIVRELARFAA